MVFGGVWLDLLSNMLLFRQHPLKVLQLSFNLLWDNSFLVTQKKTIEKPLWPHQKERKGECGVGQQKKDLFPEGRKFLIIFLSVSRNGPKRKKKTFSFFFFLFPKKSPQTTSQKTWWEVD